MRRSHSLLVALCLAPAASAVQFPTLDPAYTQEIYSGPLVGGPGMAWTNAGALLTRDGSNLYEYSLTANTVHQGTNVHGYVTHSVGGLASSGYGMANANDGYIYTATSTGLQRIDESTWTAQSLAGTTGGQGYGIHAMADGRIAYVAGSGTNEVYIYDPSANTNTLVYTNGSLIDDIAVDSAGNLALAAQVTKQLVIISSVGAVLNTVNCFHYPDGLAFGDGINTNAIFANNNDGTITRYQFGTGYVGSPSITDIASGSQAYGDLAEVGPDCAFYVSQFDNGGFHGSTAGIGTHWDNGITNNEASIIRISLKSGDCGFYHTNEPMPEPTTVLGLGAGFAFLVKKTRGRKPIRA